MAEHRTPPAAPAIPPLRIGGYDLASRLIMGTGGITDLTAFVLVGQVDGVWHA